MKLNMKSRLSVALYGAALPWLIAFGHYLDDRPVKLLFNTCFSLGLFIAIYWLGPYFEELRDKKE
ncbi:hypothetical protein [Undibacterium sp. Tian12W]|uniref:hypothetical protein n=1 Tax=Undibacterium sp. Tian12W TaxID=3413054 RepID=UPI003BEFAD49